MRNSEKENKEERRKTDKQLRVMQTMKGKYGEERMFSKNSDIEKKNQRQEDKQNETL